MPTTDDLKRSKFLAQKDVDTPILVTIAAWEEVNFSKDGAEPDMGYALTFREIDKPLSLNTTKGQIIALICQQKKGLSEQDAKDFDNWIGLRIVIYRDPNYVFGGRVTGQICVRAPKEKPGTAPPIPEEDFDPTEPPDDEVPF